MSKSKINYINICYPLPEKSTGAITSQEFLSWAKSDLKRGDKRSMGNALSNIKKSIHSRIDEIINLSHITYAKDWNKRESIDNKLKILNRINIKHTSIVRIITKIRNTYEHQYILPKDNTDIKAYYETTELWLKNSYKSYINSPLGIVNLPTYSIDYDSNRNIKKIEFPQYVDSVSIYYFWNSKNSISKITRTCRDDIKKFKELNQNEIIKIEKPFLNKKDNQSYFHLSQRDLTKVFKIYNETLHKRRYGFYLSNPIITLD